MKSRPVLKTLPALTFLLLTAGPLPDTAGGAAAPRREENFNGGWKFRLGDVRDGQAAGLADSAWRSLTLPHDWSIEGNFSESHPASPGGGALPGGIGWYRKTFKISDSDRDRLVFVDFDGIYRNAEVWINGHSLGLRPYGYSSFRLELTPYLLYGETPNVLAVRVDNSAQPNSRWYSGSGIYRNVRLVTTGRIGVDHWGTFITTPETGPERASVRAEIRIRNRTASDRAVTVSTVFRDDRGNSAAEASAGVLVPADSCASVVLNAAILNPALWSADSPRMYAAETVVADGAETLDAVTTPFGIRSFVFDREKGFLLNGRPEKLLGVCNHHDLGCLGAAVNRRALERQLEILKDMGCNAIRTSHNPPAPELLDLCDRMGFLVMDEAFDMWRKKKTEFDYSADFDAWHRRDLESMVLRDRNHPSVFAWSIGNEILEQWDSTGTPLAAELAGIVRSLDPTRPVTSACNDPRPGNAILRSGALDLIGYNYHHETFADFLTAFPEGAFIGAETTSALATRGRYDMPSDSIRRWPVAWDKPFTDGNPDHTCSSYDNCSAPWGSTHEETWRIIRRYPFLSGLFIWTGFDYLGEPTPYGWPARSSYFGVCDLAGFPKDAYYLYRSEWTDEPVLHVFPHWNWKAGDTVDVWAYTNYRTVELFLNGKSLGRREKTGDLLHLQWRVAWQPGTLKAVGSKPGWKNAVREVRTAGPPAKIVLEPDRRLIAADGEDLSFVTARVTDADGTVVPHAANRVELTVTGPGILARTDNGDPTDHDSFQSSSRRVMAGLGLAVVRSAGRPGTVIVRARSEGLQQAAAAIRAE
ncbi:MAG: beta-galactosidase GalB [bacterium]|nr:beta-galactosidase GalB [bacterium]